MQQQVQGWRDEKLASDRTGVGHRRAGRPMLHVPAGHLLLPEVPSPSDVRSHRPIPAGAWGITGFLVGAIFWHFIGFWGFVSEVVFSNRRAVEDRQIAQTGPQCLQILLDRSSGAVRGEPCAPEAPQLDESASAVKSDFLSSRRHLARGARAVRLTAGDR